eukprot:CAMPEP_0171109494 /NCGR_PEP_ID=MMETSP0766_2-20121228/70809_1 /TAXON_ID=439317 /ORGANISM="Gambierdiscus australes, Strain CAWD 149" /LENGTH=299 /DNA_ID=CAMNT_0011571237 /DNA_START=72 /DNA_END=967 /DNA_ORIENTATION=+
MAAMRSILALTLVLGCGGAPAPSFDDVSGLLQGHTAALQTVAKVEGRWPSMGDTWDQLKDSVKDMTEQVGEIADEAGDRVQQAGDVVHRIAADVAKKVAAALNQALSFVRQEADVLLNATVEEKAKMFAELNRTLTFGGKTVLPDFEKASNEAVSELWTKWASLREIVDRTADTIADALTRAGQTALGKRLDTAITASLQSLDSFMTKLKDANDSLSGIGQKAYTEAESTLLMVNDKLNKALGHVALFIVQYEQSFQDIIDQISNALATAQEEADRAFATVHHNITEIAWRVRSSSREL